MGAQRVTRPKVLPWPFTDTPRMNLRPDGDAFSTPRHETFHAVQYQYIDLNDFERHGVWAWLEATAEWATHRSGPETRYASRLPEFAARPNWWMFTFEEPIPVLGNLPYANPFADTQKRQYGTFIVAEFLEEQLDARMPAGLTAVERTWELIAGGADAPGAVSGVLAEYGASAPADLISRFRADLFVLDEQAGTQGIGFNDPDATAWRQLVGASGVASTERAMKDFDDWDPTDSERPHVAGGGAAYVEIDLTSADGNPDFAQRIVTIDTPAIPGFTYQVIGFDSFPNVCSERSWPIRIDDGPGTAGHIDLALTGECQRLVLVISDTDLTGADFPIQQFRPDFPGHGDQVDWQVGVEPITTEVELTIDWSDTDVATFGLGGLRDIGSGTIDVTGVQGTVNEALLIWHGPTNSTSPTINADITLNGQQVSGRNAGFGHDNCWRYLNSQTYIAPVTDIVTGDGTYVIDDLLKTSANGTTLANVNGVSLLIFYDDGDASNNVDSYVMYIGNDSTQRSFYDARGWDADLGTFTYSGGPVELELHVADGQAYDGRSWGEGTLWLNGQTIGTGPSLFEGDTVPDAGSATATNGALWDIKQFDITSLLSSGSNTLNVTYGGGSDCLSLVGASLVVGGVTTSPPPTAQSQTAQSASSPPALPADANGDALDE